MNSVHPTAIISESVQMGRGNTVGPFAVIQGDVSLGSENWIGPHVVIGTPAEHKTYFYSQEESVHEIQIGNRNVIREMTVIQAPTTGITRLGDDCFVMHGVHIAHDNFLGSNLTIAPGVVLGGHVSIGDYANIGIGAMVHQYICLGGFCMIGMGSVVTKNVTPGSLVMGVPAKRVRLNTVGFERAGLKLSPLEIELLEREDLESLTQSGSSALLRSVVIQYLQSS